MYVRNNTLVPLDVRQYPGRCGNSHTARSKLAKKTRALPSFVIESNMTAIILRYVRTTGYPERVLNWFRYYL